MKLASVVWCGVVYEKSWRRDTSKSRLFLDHIFLVKTLEEVADMCVSVSVCVLSVCVPVCVLSLCVLVSACVPVSVCVSLWLLSACVSVSVCAPISVRVLCLCVFLRRRLGRRLKSQSGSKS
jgi:uncharacterized membrane protein YbhN (UPF0104 family)